MPASRSKRTTSKSPVHPIEIDCLSKKDFDALVQLSHSSILPTYNDPKNLQRIIKSGVVFGTFVTKRLVGCCCVDFDVKKNYLTANGEEERSFPLPNSYLCGMFVLDAYRSLGIGRQMYQKRLDFVKRNFGGLIIVELLGDGRPYSVHAESIAGYQFYRQKGFEVAGYSVDEDAGVVLFMDLNALNT